MSEEDNLIQDDDNDNADSTVHEIEEAEVTKGDNKSTDDDEVTIETVYTEDEDESRGDN